MTTHNFEPMQQKTNTHSSDDNLPKELPIKKKRKTWKKPADKPKRPPSAYNLYFQLERERLLANEPDRAFTVEEVARIAEMQVMDLKPKRKHRKSHGKISFAELARVIADSWKELKAERKIVFEERAAYEKKRYMKAVEDWAAEKKRQQERETMGSDILKPSDAKAIKEDLVALSVHASSLQQSMKAFMQNLEHEEQLHPVDDEISFPTCSEPLQCAQACSAADQIFDMALQMNIQPPPQQEQQFQAQLLPQVQQLEPLQSQFVLSATSDIQQQFENVFHESYGGNSMMHQRTVSDLSNTQNGTQLYDQESMVNAVFQQFGMAQQEQQQQQHVMNFYQNHSGNDTEDLNFHMCNNFFQQ